MVGLLRGVGFLRRMLRDCRLAIGLVRDFVRGRYRRVPGHTILALLLAALYVLSPVDLIPDLLPIIGLVDDVVVATVCLALVEKDLREYEIWSGR